MKTLVVIGLLVCASFAHADEWVARLSCDNGAFVIDGRHSFESGFTDHQAVVRGAAVQHFQQAVKGPIALSPSGEIIVSALGAKYDGTIETQFMTVQFGGPGELVYLAHGHKLGGNRYILSVSEFSCTPGNCGPPPGTEVANYIFNNCEDAR